LLKKHTVIPFDERKSRQYYPVDETTRFPKVGESFYRIRPIDCNGQSEAKRFFMGGEPIWADIRDRIGPYRDAYYDINEAIFPELAEPSKQPRAYLITGAAGTGKTTLLYSVAFDLARDFNLGVLVHIPDTPLDTRSIRSLVDNNNPKRLIIIIRNAADNIFAIENFMLELRQKNLPVTVILEERKNEWLVATSSLNKSFIKSDFELSTLSEDEIGRILDALDAYDCLGRLKGSTRDYQENHFKSLAHKELLVALRELTSEQSFDQIVINEYESIPSEIAKKAYTFVACLGQINLPIRYGTLTSLLGISYADLQGEVFLPAEGILISVNEAGSSRHNYTYRLKARHPVIASIIFGQAAPDDESKFNIIHTLLGRLDPGYLEDNKTLREVSRGKDLINTIASHALRRAIYDRLEVMLPDSPYVQQHRSILEKELGNPDLALQYAKNAVKLAPKNKACLNTLGFVYEFAARTANEPFPRQNYLAEAERIFSDGITFDPTDFYSYLGQDALLKQQLMRETDARARKLLEVQSLSLLENAYEATGGSDRILNRLIEQQEKLGVSEDTVELIKEALESNPKNGYLRDFWIQQEIKKKRYKEALRIALDGTRYDQTSWRLNRRIARLNRILNEPLDAIKGFYEIAYRHHKGDINLAIELGAYLFINNKFDEADKVFQEARELPLFEDKKKQIREKWKDGSGKELLFEGLVGPVYGLLGKVLSIPDNYPAVFIRSGKYLDFRENDIVTYHIGFNAFGPVAYHIYLKR
jgi:tetratricopeptide (TPR) repeat protein